MSDLIRHCVKMQGVLNTALKVYIVLALPFSFAIETDNKQEGNFGLEYKLYSVLE